MEKPSNQTLRKVAKLLDERKMHYSVHPRDRCVVGSPEILVVSGNDGVGSVWVHSNGRNVYLNGTVPVEGAVMAICGPDRSLEDDYPSAMRHMSFSNVSINLETDRRDVLMPVEKAEMLKEHMDRLLGKINNQRKDLRRLHVKCMQQQGEILRMEENSLRMAVLAEGYSEGES